MKKQPVNLIDLADEINASHFIVEVIFAAVVGLECNCTPAKSGVLMVLENVSAKLGNISDDLERYRQSLPKA